MFMNPDAAASGGEHADSVALNDEDKAIFFYDSSEKKR
jgi:hypothetical protein